MEPLSLKALYLLDEHTLLFCRHGIGHFLSVHEGPQRIASIYSEYEEALADGVFLSDEPGFYKPGDFGIRIENGIEVVPANMSTYDNRRFLRFNTITLIPYERSLIDATLLTSEHINAINEYHAKVVQILEPLLKGHEAALNALHSRTVEIDFDLATMISRSKLPNQAFINISPPSLMTFLLTAVLLF